MRLASRFIVLLMHASILVLNEAGLSLVRTIASGVLFTCASNKSGSIGFGDRVASVVPLLQHLDPLLGREQIKMSDLSARF